jgi:voltage-gated potassium channel
VASLAIIGVTVVTVLVGALVIFLYDDSEFATYGEALWFTLQTATTVGYGDMTPERTIGRVVAAVVMLVSLALLTVMTATITSYFIQRSTRVSVQSNHDEITVALAELQASVRELSRQLDQVTSELEGIDETTPTDQTRS